MEPGVQQTVPEPPDSPAAAAAAVRTLEELAALLRDLRRRHARSRRDSTLTYRELATMTGWSRTAIAEYFTARTLPPTERFDALLDVLGATPAEHRALATARDRIEEANRRTRGRGSAHPAPAAPPSPRTRPEPTPRQLPARPGMFVGRARELADLDAALAEQSKADGTPVICTIGGMGGIGKTWLALHWAHGHLERFPDGQLYVDLRGFDPTGRPLDPATALRGFLAALGVLPTAIPAEQEAQAALYRSITANRRMLLVLDNARDTAQVAPLLPGGAACSVLITSRRQLTGLSAAHGARSMALDVLSDDEARQLLARHLGPGRLRLEPEAAAAVLTCCAGLPLALGIAAACAVTHPDPSLTALATELSDTAHRLDALDGGEPQADLRAVLSWSSHALSPDAADVLGLLAIAPGPDITAVAAASLLALPSTATRPLLRELDHAHLIQRHTPDRYRMHDLLRLLAAEHAQGHHTAADRQAALRRVVDFYADTARAGARLLAPHQPAWRSGESTPERVPHPLPDAASAMGWFDAEHTNLLAAQQMAGSHGWHAQVCDLAWALDPYHRRRGHLEEQAASWQGAVAGAQHLDGLDVRTQTHQMLGDAYARLGRTSDALRQLAQALDLAELSGDIAAQGEIHHSLGGAWERRGDDRRALEHAQRALTVFRIRGDAYQQARALNGVGWLQSRLGDHIEGRANCRAALALLRSHPADHRQLGESSTLDSLGHIAHCLGEHDQALGYYHQALAICRTQGHSHLEADVLQRIAGILLAQRRPGRARDIWQQARELLTAQHRLTEAEHVQRQLDSLGRLPVPWNGDRAGAATASPQRREK
ncbi:ATP-binding protein [Streptomyces sp. NBC_01198]|uniref:ATP-binding protein n=1 Tax=Streptomyces sp. NBC_01198 TaxID=2903769 RepID=UPI002E166A7F|nr:tetratricopeptide repeat protein [Streptomyces sp. NBC_01198]